MRTNENLNVVTVPLYTRDLCGIKVKRAVHSDGILHVFNYVQSVLLSGLAPLATCRLRRV